MKIKLLNTVLALALGIKCCTAAPTNNTLTNSNDNACNVQLSIRLNTDTVKSGSIIILYARLQNSSTNVISLNPSPVPAYFLTNGFGSSYQLKPPHDIILDVNSNVAGKREVTPGNFFEWPERLEVSKDIEQGDYELEPITRDVTTISNQVCNLVSNPLKLKVVK